jgi:hypothetical protein
MNPTNTETITCPCGASFEWDREQRDEFGFPPWVPSLCPECTTASNRAREESDRLERQARIDGEVSRLRAAVQHATPPLFLTTDINHPEFNARAWDRLKGWAPTAVKPFLGFVGPTGGCKSRIAYLLAGAELERVLLARMAWEPSSQTTSHPTFVFAPSYQIGEQVMRQFAGDDTVKRQARAWLDKLRRADLVWIDDLGKGRQSPAVASELFAIVDHRHTHQASMIWTSNSTAEEIASRFDREVAADMAAPFAGRLNESSRICKFS